MLFLLLEKNNIADKNSDIWTDTVSCSGLHKGLEENGIRIKFR